LKRLVLIISLLLFVFLALAVLILPEYRTSMLIIFALYSLILFFILRLSVGEAFYEFLIKLFSKRSYFIFKALFVSSLIFVFSFILFNSYFFKNIYFDLSKAKLLSLDPDSRLFLKSITQDVELLYLKSLNDDDESAFFDAILKEFRQVSKHISYKTVHPVINAAEYDELKNLVPSLSAGSVLVISNKNMDIADKLTEYQLVLSIYRAIEGKRKVCISYLNGEPSLDDYTENGAAIIRQLMKDRGVELIPVAISDMHLCQSFILFEPQKELDDTQIKELLSYKGKLLLLGGTKLKSVKKLLSSLDIVVEKNIEAEFGLGAFRDYSGVLVVDKLSDHPITKAIGGTISSASAFELSCNDCSFIAAISSSSFGEGTSYLKPVLVLKDGLFVSSLEGLTKNYFMRFKGNAELLLNSINFLISERYPYLNSVPRLGTPKMFAISGRYMGLIFLLVVWIIPLLYLFMGVYCFSKNRSS
jgi:hypothetical protein